MKKTYKTIILLVSFIILLILYLINSKYIIKCFLEYNNLFYTKLFPVSFIFFTISTILIEYKVLDIIPININSIYIYILSLISGFPSGSKYIKELLDKNSITYEEASNLILFSHFPNPLFIIGSISSILNKSICFKLLISILLSNFIILIFTKKYKKKHTTIIYPNNFSIVLKSSIYKSIKTIILIYGTSIFFYLISCIITKYISFNPYLYVLISGLFDLTKGVFSTTIINNVIIKSIFILVFISLGSISIHIQVKSILEDTSLYKSFIKGRIIGTILSIIIFILLIIPSR